MSSTNLYKDNPPDGTIGIVIPIRDNLQFFKLAFHSILSFTDIPFMITVIDNMSTWQTRYYLKSLSKNHPITIICYQKDFNYSAEVNLGIRHMFNHRNVKYGMCLNSDVVVEQKWLTKLKSSLSPSTIGIVGPVSNIAISTQQRPKQNHIWKANYVSGFCMLFKREVYEQLDGFDEQYVGGCYEDQDFCVRAIQHNWNILVNGCVYIHHFWKVTRRNDPLTDQYVEQNRERFLKKFDSQVSVI